VAKKAEDAKFLRIGYQKLGPQKLWCQVCDSRQVDSKNPATGKFFKVFGLESRLELPSTSLFFAVCPYCKYTEAVHEITDIENSLVR
jgi:hypothetical protein